MILVRLNTRDASLLTEAGSREFYGVPVTRPDGSTWIDFDDLGEPRPGQVPARASRNRYGCGIRRAISQALSSDVSFGKLPACGGFEPAALGGRRRARFARRVCGFWTSAQALGARRRSAHALVGGRPRK